MNNSNSSSTFIFSSLPCHNSFRLSKLVCSSKFSKFLVIFMVCTGFIVTYIAPLAFVLFVTMGKEAYDDYKRHLRDREANSQRYHVFAPPSTSDSDPEQEFLDTHANTFSVPSSSLRIGDLVLLEKDQRVPADMILLHTSETSGTCFIRTDQLDGETDWKLRVAIPESQKLREADLPRLDAEIYGEYCISATCWLWSKLIFSRRPDQGHSHFRRHFHTESSSRPNIV